MKVETKLFLGLFILTILLVWAYKQDTEGFESDTDVKGTINSLDKTMVNLNEFAKGIASSKNVAPEKMEEISEKIISEMKDVNQGLKLLLTKISKEEALSRNQNNLNIVKSSQITDDSSVKASQVLQDQRIIQLKNRLNNLKKSYANHLENQNRKNYPKIPVYSSCLVSEAGGKYSYDQQSQKGSVNVLDRDPVNELGSSVYMNNPAKNMETGNGSVTLDDILNKLSSGEISVNLNV